MVYLRNNSWKPYVYIVFTTGRPLCHEVLPRADIKAYPWVHGDVLYFVVYHSNMTSFKRFEYTPVVKIILIYDRLNLWRHRQLITILYQFLHIRIEIIHGSHMYILMLVPEGGRNFHLNYHSLKSLKVTLTRKTLNWRR
jgi:hypothetical protein